MSPIPLRDRAAIEIIGADAALFLQGLVTCDVEAIAPGQAGFGALLSPQAKILFDFLIFNASDRLLLDAPKTLAADLVKRLNFYKLRAQIAIRLLQDGEKPAEIIVLLDGGAVPPGAIAYDDPRAKILGKRAFCFDPSPDIGELPHYEARRVSAVAPKGGLDFQYGEVFPHDVNMDLLNGVSFDKGCYVGQEVVSRMRHRGGVRKRIVGVTIQGPAPAPSAEILADGRRIGTMGGSSGAHGLAMLRLDVVREILAREGSLFAGETQLIPDLSPFMEKSQ